ncbi:MAG: hypothetical protein WBY53_06515 [Acidobacteriaceae bacterium]
MTNDADGLSRASCHLVSSQALVIHQLDRSSLPVRKSAQDLSDQNTRFERLIPRGSNIPALDSIRTFSVERVGGEESRRVKVTASVKAPMVRKHQQPRLERRFIRIKLLDGSKYIEEDLLNCILSLRFIAENPLSNPKQQRTMAFKQRRQRIRITLLQTSRQSLVGKKLIS